VIEFHGTTKKIKCTKCNHTFKDTEIDLTQSCPTCPICKGILKPDFVFYGEPINQNIMQKAIDEILLADVLIIVGTSGQVMPANSLPYLAKQNNPNLITIEVNPDETDFTKNLDDFYFNDEATKFFNKVNEEINQLK